MSVEYPSVKNKYGRRLCTVPACGNITAIRRKNAAGALSYKPFCRRHKKGLTPEQKLFMLTQYEK